MGKMHWWEAEKRIKALESQLEAVKGCQRYDIDYAEEKPFITVTTNNPDGKWIRTADIKAAIGETKAEAHQG